MFDFKNKELIEKFVINKKEDEVIIPYYIKIYNDIYSLLEIKDIKTFNPVGFKMGFITTQSLFNNSFPNELLYIYPNTFSFRKFDKESNTDIFIHVFEYDGIIDSELYDKFSDIFDSLDEYYNLLKSYTKECYNKNKNTK